MSGVIAPKLEANGLVTVDMGVPVFEPERIPSSARRPVGAAADGRRPRSDDHRRLDGQPHAVQVVADVDRAPVEPWMAR